MPSAVAEVFKMFRDVSVDSVVDVCLDVRAPSVLDSVESFVPTVNVPVSAPRAVPVVSTVTVAVRSLLAGIVSAVESPLSVNAAGVATLVILSGALPSLRTVTSLVSVLP